MKSPVRNSGIIVGHLLASIAAAGWFAGPVRAQSASLYQQAVRAEPARGQAGGQAGAAPNSISGGIRTIEETSLIAVKLPPPRKFRKHDVISIIVREQKKYKTESDLEEEKKWDLTAKLQDWFRFYPRQRLGSDKLPNGQPGVKFKFDNQLEHEGEHERKDDLTLRIAAEVIDVKPNGQLVLEAKKRIKNDEEVQNITLTGTCRSEDVTADNTVLSTQVLNLQIDIQHTGAMRDASRRGWIPRLFDFLRPF